MAPTNINFAALDEVITAARRSDLTTVDRGALYGAAVTYADRIRAYLDDHHRDGKEYERGKLTSVVSNLSILLGFGIYEADKPHAGNWTAVDHDWQTFQSGMRDG